MSVYLYHSLVHQILFAPSQAHHLYPYPRHHPNGGSTQVVYPEKLSLSSLASSPQQVLDLATKFRNISLAEGYRATLSAGDIIYIPPFWFTQAHFKRSSILLKTFFSIYEGDVLDELLRSPIPHIDHIDSEVAAVKRAIDRIIMDGMGVDNTSGFISNLLRSRYLPLYGSLQVSTSTDFTPCFEVDKNNEKFMMDFMGEYLGQVTKAIKALDALGLVKDLVLEEFLEHLVHKTLGAEDAYNFYANCFDTGISNSRSTAQDIE
jgi:hypothetical protein